MNKAYLITYDMNSNDDYSGLEMEIRKYRRWCRVLTKTWIIISNETPFEIWNNLKGEINKNNGFFIIEIKNNSEGWLSREIWDWIKENVEN